MCIDNSRRSLVLCQTLTDFSKCTNCFLGSLKKFSSVWSASIRFWGMPQRLSQANNSSAALVQACSMICSTALVHSCSEHIHCWVSYPGRWHLRNSLSTLMVRAVNRPEIELPPRSGRLWCRRAGGFSQPIFHRAEALQS